MVLEPIDREEAATMSFAVQGADLLQARRGDARHEQRQA